MLFRSQMMKSNHLADKLALEKANIEKSKPVSRIENETNLLNEIINLKKINEELRIRVESLEKSTNQLPGIERFKIVKDEVTKKRKCKNYHKSS